MSELLKMIDQVLKDRNLSDAAASRLIANNPSVIKNMRLGQVPNYDRIKQIADALDLEFYIGPKREPLEQPEYIIDDGTYGIIPVRDVEVAAGLGHANSNHDHIAQLAFRIDWLKMHSVNPQMACLVRAKGDSMEPTIPDGSLVLVDHQRTDPHEKGIYVFLNPDGEARVKRLSMPNNKSLMVESDNRKYPAELIEKSEMNRQKIIGKVVWYGVTINREDDKI